MAVQTAVIDLDTWLPLVEHTNSSTETNVSQSSEARYLRHKHSMRNFAYQYDSSDTLPSGSDSIYNADIVISDGYRSPTETSSSVHSSPPPGSPVIPPLPFLSRDRSSGVSSPHSGWPVTQLEPIIERRSIGQLSKSSSVPRLQPSPERTLQVVRPQLSAHSIRPKEFMDLLPPVLEQSDPYRVRSFSLNDLDCLPWSDTEQALPRCRERRSSSAEEILRATRLCAMFPLKPVHLQPYRSPTPPGLPSFGTREAQEFRLSPASPPNQAMAFIRKWLRQSHVTNDERGATSSSLDAPTSPVPYKPVSSSPMTMLRRALGVARRVECPPHQVLNPRSSLPPGISVATAPGPLARADDGTLVRGHWGIRASAHGVGRRGLDSHPLARGAGTDCIDEMVRDIDKACEAADERNTDRQMLATSSLAETIQSPVLSQTEPADLAPQQVPDLSGTIGGTYAHPLDLGLSRVKPSTNSNNETSINLTDSIFSPTPSIRMIGPMQYASMSPQASTRQDSVAGFRDYIEQQERERVRQSLESQKEESSWCQDCWEGFWSLCCNPKGRGLQR